MSKHSKYMSISGFCEKNGFRTYKFYKTLNRYPEPARRKARRGVGASLNSDELSAWEHEHKALLKNIAPDKFDILHYGALAVLQKANYAEKMYRKLGFQVIEETEEEYIMIYISGYFYCRFINYQHFRRFLIVQ